MKTETDLKYKYTHITKGSIKNPQKHKYLKIKFKRVRYIEWWSFIFQKRIFLDQNHWLFLFCVRSSLTQKNLKCRTFLSSFSGQVTQVRTQLLFTYIQTATLTVSKLRGWLVNPTPPLLWDHPCSVIFHHQGQILFSLLTCTPFFLKPARASPFTRYTDIEPAAISDCSQMIKKYNYIAIN